MNWVPSPTSDTYQLHDLNILLDVPEFPYLKNKVVIIILTLEGYKACIFKLPGTCWCLINACALSPLLSFPFLVLSQLIIQSWQWFPPKLTFKFPLLFVYLQKLLSSTFDLVNQNLQEWGIVTLTNPPGVWELCLSLPCINFP